MMKRIALFVLFVAVVFCFSSEASAQARPKVALPSVSSPISPNSSQIRNQYEQYQRRRPSVSPYLNLINGGDPNLTNYQSLVRPQVNQRQINSQQGSQINRLEARPPTSGNAGSESLRSTGHQATWRNYSHYYPSLR